MVLLYLTDTALWELVVNGFDRRYTITTIIVLGITDTTETFKFESPTLWKRLVLNRRHLAIGVSNADRFRVSWDP